MMPMRALALAEQQSKKLGRFTVRVTSVTTNTVDVELGQ